MDNALTINYLDKYATMYNVVNPTMRKVINAIVRDIKEYQYIVANATPDAIGLFWYLGERHNISTINIELTVRLSRYERLTGNPYTGK